ncbi:AAC(3) family N-acetyltransferase [Actinomycetaceae bacterium MB13-C1-2]|nr:AAC(3) family N-acetyltransferase [Actinomycetaceae bacterium MB13-C1-2]
MHNVSGLENDLGSWGVPREATLLIHSSMKSIGQVQGGADSVIETLSSFFDPGLLVLPTHTWMSVHQDGDVFDVETSPSCVGVLPDIFRGRNDVIRSWHPTHSVAVRGADAEEFTDGEQLARTPCPKDGVYGRLLDREAYIAFLGCPMTKNTYVHGVEEWARVPNRIASEATQLSVRTPEGEIIDAPQFMHKAPIDDVSSNYGKLQEPLSRFGLLHQGRFGDATVLVTTARGVFDLTAHLLAQDPDLFLTSEAVPEELLEGFVGGRR